MNNRVFCIFFSQLFGEEDPDQDVSPDTEDPEAAAEAGDAALAQEAKQDTIGICWGFASCSTRLLPMLGFKVIL